MLPDVVRRVLRRRQVGTCNHNPSFCPEHGWGAHTDPLEG
jgi:hypothetical protein